MSRIQWIVCASVLFTGSCGDDGSDPVDATVESDGTLADADLPDAIPPDAADMVAPSFSGLVSASELGPNVVRLTWMPASDDISSSLAIVYRVYVAASAGSQTFDTPTASSSPGATQMALTLGPSVAGTTAHFVVRAEDEAGNRDTNTVERSVSFAAALSFAAHIEPLLNQGCGGSACHGGNNPKAGLNLTTGLSYDALVGVDASQCVDATVRVLVNDPDASYLVRKLRGLNLCMGSQMPPGGSLSDGEIKIISDWITAGALEN